MQTKIIFFILFCCCGFYLSGQNTGKRDTFVVRSQAVTVTIPKSAGNIGKYSGISVKTDGSDQSGLTEESGITKRETEEITGKSGTTEGTVRSETTKENGDLKVVFSYQVNYEGQDFSLGDYIVNASVGLKEMLFFMKKNVEGDLAEYLTPPRRVSITITGGADATPINGPIQYNSEFGTVINENCLFSGRSERMRVIANQIITDNSILAFLRSVAAKDYITHNIFVKNSLQPEYYLSATVSPEKGGQYRRVSVEMIIHDVNK